MLGSFVTTNLRFIQKKCGCLLLHSLNAKLHWHSVFKLVLFKNLIRALLESFNLVSTPTDAYIACPMCDVLHQKIALDHGMRARCSVCRTVLYCTHALSENGKSLDALCRGALNVWIAFVCTALMLFVMAQVCTLAQCNLHGQVIHVTLWGAVCQLLAGGNVWLMGLGVCVVYLIVVVPVLQGGALLYLLLPRRFAVFKKECFSSMSYRRLVFSVLQHLQHWGMMDVLLLSALVTFIKFSDIAPITTGVALPALAGLAILQSVLSIVGLPAIQGGSEHRTTSKVGPFGQLRTLPKKTSRSLQYVWALWLSALLLYVPAMLLPMMHSRSFLSSGGSTLLEGIVHFWVTGSWGLAVLILVASVCVPLLKLAVLGVLLWCAQRGVGGRPQQYRWLYQWIQMLGRWSMLDIFVLILTMAIMRFYAFATLTAGVGAVVFAAVVMLTLYATHAFDPRWIGKSRI